MKWYICLVLMTIVINQTLAETSLYPRGCIYVNGRCQRECEEGTHSYTTGCGYLTPEATCEEPNPVTDKRGKICDYSSCYCDPGTVRDKTVDKCVAIEKCLKQKTDE